MKMLRGKYFVLGNIIVLLIAIPVTIFFVKRQQELRSRATPSTTLQFNPSPISKSRVCTSFFSDIMINPGQNAVISVKIALTYSPALLEVVDIVPEPNLTLVGNKTITAGSATATYTTGTDPSRAIQTPGKIARVTFKPLGPGSAQVVFSADTRVISQGTSDLPTENVLSSSTPLNATITDTATCDGASTASSPTATPTTAVSSSNSPTPTPTTSPGATGNGTGAGTGAGTPTPTPGINTVPVCTELSATPSNSGAAPFSVLFTAKGNDPDGLIAKATFTFGDGQVQNITDALNSKDAVIQTNHTFQTEGTYDTTLIFTDNRSGISGACSQTIIVASGSGSTTTPTPTTASGATTSTPAPTSSAAAPTIAPTGSVATTIGIIGAIILTVIGGIFLLAL